MQPLLPLSTNWIYFILFTIKMLEKRDKNVTSTQGMTGTFTNKFLVEFYPNLT